MPTHVHKVIHLVIHLVVGTFEQGWRSWVEKDLVALVIGVDDSYHLSQTVNFVQENDHQ
jgi:hypothetical protein